MTFAIKHGSSPEAAPVPSPSFILAHITLLHGNLYSQGNPRDPELPLAKGRHAVKMIRLGPLLGQTPSKTLRRAEQMCSHGYIFCTKCAKVRCFNHQLRPLSPSTLLSHPTWFQLPPESSQEELGGNTCRENSVVWIM